MNTIEYYDIVVPALEKAGKAILTFYGDHGAVETKGDGSPLTKADRASHSILVDELAQTGITVFTEESGTSYPPDSVFWCIDPLDGTKDFIHQTGDFSILVALIENQKPTVGFVYQPITQALYFGALGKGAFHVAPGKQPQQLQVNQEIPFSDQSMVVSKFHLRDIEKSIKEELGLADFIQKGSCGLKMCDIAMGVTHIYINTSDKTSEWDTAAGQVILHEAGGILTNCNGEPLGYAKDNPSNPNGIVASIDYDHERIINVLKKLL